MRIALISADDREQYKRYDLETPIVPTPQEALLQGLGHYPDIEVHLVTCLQSRARSPEKLAGNVWFHSLHVPKTGWMRTGYQGCIRAVRKKLREIQPDIVHGQGTERDCALSAVFSGYPNVLTLHGNMRLVAEVNQARPFSFLWLAARLEGFTLPRTDGVVCITNYTRQAVQDLARRTWVLPNAVDEGFFDVAAAPDLTAPPVILCVGAVCPRKNQNAFIRALDPLAAQRKISAVFVGRPDTGAYSAEFFQLIRDRPWCQHYQFSGRDRVKAHLQTATLLALPTREDNCPMTVLEAMAAGVPVLASKVGGVPDLIEPEVTGLFCDPQQPDSFRTGVTRLLDDREFAQKLAARAKAEARRRFHPQVIAQRHLEIYREIVGVKRKAET